MINTTAYKQLNIFHTNYIKEPQLSQRYYTTLHINFSSQAMYHTPFQSEDQQYNIVI